MKPKDSKEVLDLTRILYRAMNNAVDRMTELSAELLRRFERDKDRATGEEARRILDTVDASAGARILDRLGELVAAGLPAELARSILTRMAGHSQGWTVHTAYRFQLGMERDAMAAKMREGSARIIGEAAGEAMQRTAYEAQVAQGVAFKVPDFSRRMIDALRENPQRSMWLLMAKKADGELEVPDTGAMRRDPDGVLRAFTDGDGHRILPETINLSAVSKWMDDVSASTERDIYSTCIAGVKTGRSPDEVGRDLEAVRDTAPWRCRAMARTMYTETAAQADKAEREQLHIEEYVYRCGLDEKTCPVCGALDGRVFKVSESRAGVNFPPMHPNCRCTTISLPGRKAGGKVVDVDGRRIYAPPTGERAGYVIVRDDAGNVVKRKYARVPASTTYEQWKRIQEGLSPR